MALEDQVAQFVNPQEFTRLCNAIFNDIYGHGYQVIDGTRSDNGNDGYIRAETRLLAMYCPIKPEQRTDEHFLKKIRDDLAKAAKLKADGAYAIDQWTFVTPRKLSDNVIQVMVADAAAVGITASHQESTYLAGELLRRPHILKDFPQLQVIDVAAQLAELKNSIDALGAQRVAHPEQARPIAVPVVTDQASHQRLHALAGGIPSAAAKAELRQIAFATQDPVVEVNSILTLLRWFEPGDDDRGELIAFADRAKHLAAQLGFRDVEAWTHASKAQLLVLDLNFEVVEAFGHHMIEQKLGFPLATADHKRGQLDRLRTLDDAWRREVRGSLELLKEIGDPGAAAGALLILGTTWGLLAHVRRIVGEPKDADRLLTECKMLLMASKDLSTAAGNELGACNAVFNLANQIRFHGREADALELVKGVIRVAERHGDQLMLQKAKWLQETLTTGSMPAYEKGERRVWPSPGPSGSS